MLKYNLCKCIIMQLQHLSFFNRGRESRERLWGLIRLRFATPRLKATSKNCFAGDLRNFLSRDMPRCVFTIFWPIIAGYATPKEIERFRKKHNVAIKRAKNNASALALSSVSNIDEVDHAKVSKNTLWFVRNVEFLEVAF